MGGLGRWREGREGNRNLRTRVEVLGDGVVQYQARKYEPVVEGNEFIC